jgi:hypothetical protein
MNITKILFEGGPLDGKSEKRVLPPDRPNEEPPCFKVLLPKRPEDGLKSPVRMGTYARAEIHEGLAIF